MTKLLAPDMAQAVCISSLESLAQSGIYFLIHEGVVVYVGQARDMRRRVASHIGDGTKVFDTVARVPCVAADLDQLERAYIEELVPKYNRCCLSAFLREVGVESATGGRLTGEKRRVRRPRSNARRIVTVLA